MIGNIGHIKAVIDKYTCSICKTLDGSRVLLSGRCTPPWPDCANDRCRCKVRPDENRLKYAADAVLCFFGLHSWGLSLNSLGEQFFARLGMTAAINVQCERLWCRKVKTYEKTTKAM